MALELSLSSAESNDNTTLTLTDNAGAYDLLTNDTGWGAPNLTVATITTLTLDVVITTADGTETTYDQIDLATDFAPLADRSDLVYPLTPALLLVSGTALGAATDELPDGLYDLTYIVDEGEIVNDTHEVTILVYGKVKVKVYEKLAAISTAYACNDCDSNKTIRDADMYGAYLYSIETWDYSAKDEEVLSMLVALNNMVINEVSIAW